MKAKKSALLKRKACVMNKTMELSILCDVKACAIIVDADGSIQTWPKDVTPILDHYRQKHSSNNMKQTNNNVVVADESNNPKDVLSKLDSKIEAVKKRMDLLKGKSVGDGEREEFTGILNEIIGTSAANMDTDQEIDEPLGCYFDGEIEQKSSYSWSDGLLFHNIDNQNYSADFSLLLREDFWSTY